MAIGPIEPEEPTASKAYVLYWKNTATGVKNRQWVAGMTMTKVEETDDLGVLIDPKVKPISDDAPEWEPQRGADTWNNRVGGTPRQCIYDSVKEEVRLATQAEQDARAADVKPLYVRQQVDQMKAALTPTNAAGKAYKAMLRKQLGLTEKQYDDALTAEYDALTADDFDDEEPSTG